MKFNTEAHEAVSKLTKMDMVLNETAAKKVSKAVKEVHDIAKQIVKKVSAGGVTTAEVVASIKFQALEEARFAFFDEGTSVEAAMLPATDVCGLDEIVEGDWSQSTNATTTHVADKKPDDMKAAVSEDTHA